MNWYYVDGGQQAGPVEDAQLEELLRSGKIQADTLVWREGMTNWMPYREAVPGAAAAVPPLASAPPVGVTGGLVCTECGRSFPPDEVIRYEDKWVCAGCKPVFFQRLREGAAPGAAGAGMATEADLLARDYTVEVGPCLTRSWEVFKANAGLLIGGSVLVYLAMAAANIIPYLNVLLAFFVTGPLMGGLWFLYIKILRSQAATIGDAFSGFGPKYWQFVLVQLIPALIAMGTVFLFAMVAAMTIPAIAAANRGGGGGSAVAPALLIPLGGVFFVVVVVMIYLNVCWMFALPLVADKGLRFWPALELSRKVVKKHWWMTFWLLFVCGILSLLGLLACGLGLLVTGPVAFAMLACHYDRVFGDLAPARS